ncbi:ribosomal RNA assembly protein [Vigna unguiculata]|uniref:KRR-R motif-containing protein 1 n=1 Tax=Vigna unguiculata TaxID=3917 RepID=A0A4D6NGV5_VIGUN|nr:ribosomal RNA assembly protein [Vigna unguiculata]
MPDVKSALKQCGIHGVLNLDEGSMTVLTTRNTRDPYIIIKSRDLIKPLARNVPAPQALTILEDDMQCNIINIYRMVPNKRRFIIRLRHLLGPNGVTLKVVGKG